MICERCGGNHREQAAYMPCVTYWRDLARQRLETIKHIVAYAYEQLSEEEKEKAREMWFAPLEK